MFGTTNSDTDESEYAVIVALLLETEIVNPSTVCSFAPTGTISLLKTSICEFINSDTVSGSVGFSVSTTNSTFASNSEVNEE